MIELLLNELLSTFPFHFLAYIPFYKKLKYSPLGTFLRVCMCQIFYLGIFTLLTLAGFSSVCVQYLAVPIFGILFCLLVQADLGMILFFYMFILDYLLVIRAAAFCICEKLFGFNFFSWQSGFITLFLILCTILLMVKAMNHITKGLCSLRHPQPGGHLPLCVRGPALPPGPECEAHHRRLRHCQLGDRFRPHRPAAHALYRRHRTHRPGGSRCHPQ